MPTVAFEYRSESERIAMERAVAFVAEMHSLAQASPDGEVLQACEAHALDAGRNLLRNTLQQAVQHRIDDAEKKGAPPASARAPAGSASSGAALGTFEPRSGRSTSAVLMAIAPLASNPSSRPIACSASTAG